MALPSACRSSVASPVKNSDPSERNSRTDTARGFSRTPGRSRRASGTVNVAGNLAGL